MEIKIKSLVGNESLCPFNGATFDFVSQCPKGKSLLDRIDALYMQINHPFSSPGNSFLRNVVYELNYQYTYHKPSKKSLFAFAARDPELKREYDLCFSELSAIASLHKFRILDLSIIEQIESLNQVVLTSDWLTEEGMKATINTIDNFPPQLLDEVIYKSIK